jgi:hypothetical protein
MGNRLTIRERGMGTVWLHLFKVHFSDRHVLVMWARQTMARAQVAASAGPRPTGSNYRPLTRDDDRFSGNPGLSSTSALGVSISRYGHPGG